MEANTSFTSRSSTSIKYTDKQLEQLRPVATESVIEDIDHLMTLDQPSLIKHIVETAAKDPKRVASMFIHVIEKFHTLVDEHNDLVDLNDHFLMDKPAGYQVPLYPTHDDPVPDEKGAEEEEAVQEVAIKVEGKVKKHPNKHHCTLALSELKAIRPAPSEKNIKRYEGRSFPRFVIDDAEYAVLLHHRIENGGKGRWRGKEVKEGEVEEVVEEKKEPAHGSKRKAVAAVASAPEAKKGKKGKE